MNIRTISIGFIAVTLFAAQSALAETTASVQNITPSTSVMAKNRISFTVKTAGYTASLFQVSDSFSGSTVSNENFNLGGNFSWVPVTSDVGTHNFTITARDFEDHFATVTQTIIVLPPPTVTINSVSPTGKVMAGNKFSFNVTTSGFSSPTFTLGDSFSGSTVTMQNLSGNAFSWTPDISQNGQHRITVYANDNQSHSATAYVDLQVGAGPQIIAQVMSTSTTVSPGTPISLIIVPSQFTPTGYSVSDSFSGKTSLDNSSVNTNGSFYWIPQTTDVGTHVVTLRGQVGAYGDFASTTITLTVLGPNGTVLGASTSASAAAATIPAGSNLDSLQAQLASLMSQIQTQTKTSETTPAAVSAMFTAYLKPGVQNDQVTHLQELLSKLGFYSGEVTGYYGNMTVDAVAKFQESKGLAALGVVGPATRAALNALSAGTASAATIPATTSAAGSGFKFEHFMGYGDDDADVVELQKFLASYNYMSASPTGFYGKATEAAVRKFQSARGLPETGYCDKATRAELNK